MRKEVRDCDDYSQAVEPTDKGNLLWSTSDQQAVRDYGGKQVEKDYWAQKAVWLGGEGCSYPRKGM